MNEMIKMLKNVNLSSLRNEKSLDDLIERCKQEGRVEGAIEELKDTLTTLKAIDSELDRRNVDMMLKTLIKIKEKRLKELQQTDVCLSHKPSVCSMGGKE